MNPYILIIIISLICLPQLIANKDETGIFLISLCLIGGIYGYFKNKEK